MSILVLNACGWEIHDEDSLVESENILEREPEKKPENFLLEDESEELLASFDLDDFTKEMIRLYVMELDSFMNQGVQLHIAQKLQEFIEENRIDEIDDINKTLRIIQSEYYPFCDSPYANPIWLWQYFAHFVEKDMIPWSLREDWLRRYFDPVYNLHTELCEDWVGKFCPIEDYCPQKIDTPQDPYPPEPMKI